MKTKRLTQMDESKTHRHGGIGRMLSRCCWNSRVKFPVMLAATIILLAGTSARAIDPIGVFAKIDKVVLEPSESSPARIQLWGAFCVADPRDRDSYEPPQKGYLFYKLPAEKSEVARKEWNDLKAAASSGDVIGFGSRYATKPKVRSAQDKPEDPDVYALGFGLVRSHQRGSSYAPIKALLADRKKASVETKEAPGVSPGKTAK